MAILFAKLLCDNSINNEKKSQHVRSKISIKTFTNIKIFANIKLYGT